MGGDPWVADVRGRADVAFELAGFRVLARPITVEDLLDKIES